MDTQRVRARSRIWTHRSMAYKTCMVSLMVGIGPFLLGFAAPDWLLFSQQGANKTERLRFGLWELCIGQKCSSNPVTGNRVVDDWFLTVVVFQTLALPFYITALVLASLQNFAPRRWLQTLQHQNLRKVLDKDSETPEDMAFIAGFLGFLGIIVFMIMTAEPVSKGAYYSWGFAMSFTGASIPVITGVVMCKAHALSSSPVQPPAEPRVVHTLSPPGRRRSDRSSDRHGDSQPERHANRRSNRHGDRRSDIHGDRHEDRRYRR